MTVFFLAGTLLLGGCAPAPDIWGNSLPPAPQVTSIYYRTETPAATFTLLPTTTLLPTKTFTPTRTPIPTATLTPTPSFKSIKRVLIVSFDGLRPDAIAAAPMENLQKLADGGAYSFTSDRTIAYPATSPSHASMLSGLCMEDHGVIYNKYFMYMGYSKGVDIFDLAHEAGLRTVMIVSKDKLRQMAEPETTDVFEIAYGEPAIVRAVLPQIDEGFGLMFIHFAGADNRGHKYGWMSGEYLKILRDGDEAFGEILKSLEENKLLDSTLIIITADHGGHDKNHIGLIIEDYRIPFIAYGPGVVQKELTLPMYTMDTAATAAYALGLPLQPDWDGIPVYEAFGFPQIATHEKDPCK